MEAKETDRHAAPIGWTRDNIVLGKLCGMKLRKKKK
jgi:hypothetical protein